MLFHPGYYPDMRKSERTTPFENKAKFWALMSFILLRRFLGMKECAGHQKTKHKR